MRIGEAAKATGMTTSRIRFYEDSGLLAPTLRTPSGYREYSDGDVNRLRLIAQARSLSIPLPEVKQIVGMAFDGACDTVRAELLTAVNSRIMETRTRIRELRSLQRELERVAGDLADARCRSTSSPEPNGCVCLDGLTSSHRAERDESHRNPEGGA